MTLVLSYTWCHFLEACRGMECVPFQQKQFCSWDIKMLTTHSGKRTRFMIRQKRISLNAKTSMAEGPVGFCADLSFFGAEKLFFEKMLLDLIVVLHESFLIRWIIFFWPSNLFKAGPELSTTCFKCHHQSSWMTLMLVGTYREERKWPGCKNGLRSNVHGRLEEKKEEKCWRRRPNIF